MKSFYATIKVDGFNFGPAHEDFKAWAKKHVGMRVQIEPIMPESKDQRRFFEGAVIPLICFYQEGMSHRNPDDIARVREWLKIEFNGEYVLMDGKQHLVPKSTKGELNKGFLESVIDWMSDQGYKTELLKPKDYKHWKDAIFSFDKNGPATYIDYLISLNKLP